MKRFIAVVFFLGMIACLISSFKRNTDDGKSLFIANCSMCHAVNKSVVGPPFQFIRRDYDKAWIYSFIRNGDSMVQAGNLRAAYIYEVYNKIQPHQWSLSNAAIDAILDYADSMPVKDTSFYLHRRLGDQQKENILHWLQTGGFSMNRKHEILDSLKLK